MITEKKRNWLEKIVLLWQLKLNGQKNCGHWITQYIISTEEINDKEQKNSPIRRRNQDIDENKVKFAAKFTVEAESRGIRKNLTMFFSKWEDLKPLLGMDWLRKCSWTIRNIGSTTMITDWSEKDELFLTFEKVIKTNWPNRFTQITIQLKPGHSPIKQTARPIRYHLQSYVENSTWTFTGNTKRRSLFHISGSNKREKRKIGQNCFRFRKIER